MKKCLIAAAAATSLLLSACSSTAPAQSAPPPSELPASSLPAETATPEPTVTPSAEISLEPTIAPSTPPLPENPQGDITQYFKDGFGELRSVKAVNKEDKSVIIVNAKIESQINNKLTIQQTFHDVADLIKNQGADRFDELQYWALADTRDGDEIKVISFTLDGDLIKAVYNDNILPIEMADYVSDLYIHPALQG